jgi:hypothetical protein
MNCQIILFLSILCIIETHALYHQCKVHSIIHYERIRNSGSYATFRVSIVANDVEYCGYIQHRTYDSYAELLRKIDDNKLSVQCWLSSTKIIYEKDYMDLMDSSNGDSISNTVIGIILLIACFCVYNIRSPHLPSF